MKYLKSLSLLIIVVLLMGCPTQQAADGEAGSGGAGVNGTAGTPPPEEGVELMKGGTLRLPLEIAVDDPAIAALDFTVPQLWPLARAIEVPVTGRHQDGAGILGFCVIETISGSGQIWTLQVLNVKESIDGPTMVAERLLAHWKKLLKAPTNPLNAQMADLIMGALDYREGRATDVTGLEVENNRLRISLTRNFFNFSVWLSQPGLGLVSPGDPHESGYGPFLFTGIEGNELVLVRNPDYAGDPALLDEIRFVCELDREKQVEMFRNKQLDAANILDAKVARIAADDVLKHSLIEHETAATLVGIMNYSHFPWDDGEFQSRVGLRQAMNWGIDRETLATMHNGQFAPWPHLLPNAFKNFIDPADIDDPLYSLTSQIEDAREGLRLADHDQGIRLPTGMDCAFLPEDNVTDLARDILEYWNEVSVKMAPFSEPRETLFERIDATHHEVILRPVRPAYFAPEAFFYSLLHSNLAGLGGNWSIIEEPGFDTALDDIFKEDDPVALRLRYHKLGHELEERALFIFIGYQTPTLLINQQLGGFELTPMDFDAALGNQDYASLGYIGE